MVKATGRALFAQSQSDTYSKQEEEPQPEIQHRDVSIADFHIAPGPKQLKRCNNILRALSSTDNLGVIPQVFKALDETFFNGRVGKVARAVGVRSKTSYTAGVGGYSFREAGRFVIRLPTWNGKTSTLRDDLNILFREMAYLDFYEINACQCEECLCSYGDKVYEFVEYLTRLDKLANLHLEGFQKQWNIREDDDIKWISKISNQDREREQATRTSEDTVPVDYVRYVEELEEDVEQLEGNVEQLEENVEQLGEGVEQLKEGYTRCVEKLEEAVDRAKHFEKLYWGVLASTTVVEAPQRRKSIC